MMRNLAGYRDLKFMDPSVALSWKLNKAAHTLKYRISVEDARQKV